MFVHVANSFSIGLLGDSHNQNDKIDEILNKHPEITQWIHGGDLTSFDYPSAADNNKTEEWYFKNKHKFVTLVKSNHDHVVAQKYINITHDFAWALAQHSKQVKIILPDLSELLIYHSRPNDFWEFTDKTIPEREFIDEYPTDELTRAVVIFHNHSQFKKNFVAIDAELWSIGAVKDGNYAILTENGIEFKKL